MYRNQRWVTSLNCISFLFLSHKQRLNVFTNSISSSSNVSCWAFIWFSIWQIAQLCLRVSFFCNNLVNDQCVKVCVWVSERVCEYVCNMNMIFVRSVYIIYFYFACGKFADVFWAFVKANILFVLKKKNTMIGL